MFNLGVKVWNTTSNNTSSFMAGFLNAYLARDKQFKTSWNPFHPRAEIVHNIQNWMVQKLNIVKSYKKYYH
jgi:hypothetical protein